MEIMKLTYTEEGTWKEHEVEVPYQMVKLATKLAHSVDEEITLEDIDFKTYSTLYGHVRLASDGKSLIFNVNLAKTRVDREIGKESYIVRIEKLVD